LLAVVGVGIIVVTHALAAGGRVTAISYLVIVLGTAEAGVRGYCIGIPTPQRMTTFNISLDLGSLGILTGHAVNQYTVLVFLARNDLKFCSVITGIERGEDVPGCETRENSVAILRMKTRVFCHALILRMGTFT
jgi:hypothetical protein